MKFLKIITLFSALIASGSSLAHVSMTDSSPSNNAMLMGSPETITLEFSTAVKLVKLTLSDAQNQHIALTLPQSSTMEQQWVVPIVAIAPSNYTTRWMVLGKDGHKMKGSFSFMVHGATQTQGTKETQGMSPKPNR